MMARGKRNEALHPYWLVAVALVASLAVLFAFDAIFAQRDEARFRNATEQVHDSILRRLDAYIAILLSTRSLFIAGDSDVDLDTFKTFVRELHIENRYPGLQGVGFTRRMMPHEVETVLAAIRAQGQSDLVRVWPDTPRDEYHAIVFLEPLDRRNRAAIGYDMFSEPVRHDAMARARDTGAPATTGKVTLVQEIDPVKQAGFLIYVPLYAGGVVPEQLAQRREKLLGFVYSPFRVDDLMRGIFGTQREPRVEVEIFDGSERTAEQRLHGGIADEARLAQFDTVVTVVVGDRTWSLRMRSTPAFESASGRRAMPALVLVALFVNVALVLGARAQVRAGRKENAARDRLATLAEASRLFSEARLDLATVLRVVCREVAERLRESCTINLLDVSGERLELAETAHVDAAAEASTRAALTKEPVALGKTIVGEVAQTAKPVLIKRVPGPSPAAAAQPDYRQHLERFPLGSVIVVPLRVADRIIGTLTVGRSPSLPPYEEDDLALVADIADRAGFAIENARLAEQLRESSSAAQRAVRLRDEFLAIAGHELRTPLAALQLQLDALVRLAEKHAGERLFIERLNKARSHVGRLEVLITDLLDVSRIAAGKLNLRREDVDLGALTAEIVDRFAEPLRRAGCEVNLDVAPVVGRWDKARLDQLITNLVANAIKYGAGKPIDVEVGAADGRARLTVRDHGIGIAPEDKARIFGRFERAVPDRNYGGLGLGLWISRQIVDALGGSIDLESELNVGSTFKVELPIDEEKSDRDPHRG